MQMDSENLQGCAVSETQSCIFIKSHIFQDSMIPSYGSGQGRALILKEGDVFSYVPEPNYTDFQQNITMKGIRNDFLNFELKFPTEFEFQVSSQVEFSFHKFLMITHEISPIFCIRTRWNGQNYPILTILNLRSTSLRFSAHPFRMHKSSFLIL